MRLFRCCFGAPQKVDVEVKVVEPAQTPTPPETQTHRVPRAQHRQHLQLDPPSSAAQDAVEVLVTPLAAEKLREGRELEKLMNKSGVRARVVASMGADDGSYVELSGEEPQLEKALTELHNIALNGSRRYGRSFAARKTLKVESKKIGWLRGSLNANLNRIQDRTNTTIHVEPERETRSDFQQVQIYGETVADVIQAVQQVKQSLNRYDSEKAENKPQPSLNREGDVGPYRPLFSMHKDKLRQQSVDKKQRRFRDLSSPKEETVEFVNNLRCIVTVEARRILFGCLIGRNHDNINRIRNATDAMVEIEEEDETKDFQRVHVNGSLVEVVNTVLEIRQSFESFDPRRPDSQRRMDKAGVSLDQVKKLKGQATISLPSEAAGFLIGREGVNINKIKSQTGAELLFVHKPEYEPGFKTVHAAGELHTVTYAMRRVRDWLGKFQLDPAHHTSSSVSRTSGDERDLSTPRNGEKSDSPQPRRSNHSRVPDKIGLPPPPGIELTVSETSNIYRPFGNR